MKYEKACATLTHHVLGHKAVVKTYSKPQKNSVHFLYQSVSLRPTITKFTGVSDEEASSSRLES